MQSGSASSLCHFICAMAVAHEHLQTNTPQPDLLILMLSPLDLLWSFNSNIFLPLFSSEWLDVCCFFLFIMPTGHYVTEEGGHERASWSKLRSCDTRVIRLMWGLCLALSSCLCLTQEAHISAASSLFPFSRMPISHLSIHKEIAVSVQNSTIIKDP